MVSNVEKAKRFLKAMASGDSATISALLNSNVVWNLPDSLSQFGYPTQTHGSDAVVSIAQNFASIFREVSGDILSAGADGDMVGCFVRIHGETQDSRNYDNLYTFWLRFKDGLIVEGREMTDTYFAAQFFGLKPV